MSLPSLHNLSLASVGAGGEGGEEGAAPGGGTNNDNPTLYARFATYECEYGIFKVHLDVVDTVRCFNTNGDTILADPDGDDVGDEKDEYLYVRLFNVKQQYTWGQRQPANGVNGWLSPPLIQVWTESPAYLRKPPGQREWQSHYGSTVRLRPRMDTSTACPSDSTEFRNPYAEQDANGEYRKANVALGEVMGVPGNKVDDVGHLLYPPSDASSRWTKQVQEFLEQFGPFAAASLAEQIYTEVGSNPEHDREAGRVDEEALLGHWAQLGGSWEGVKVIEWQMKSQARYKKTANGGLIAIAKVLQDSSSGPVNDSNRWTYNMSDFQWARFKEFAAEEEAGRPQKRQKGEKFYALRSASDTRGDMNSELRGTVAEKALAKMSEHKSPFVVDECYPDIQKQMDAAMQTRATAKYSDTRHHRGWDVDLDESGPLWISGMTREAAPFTELLFWTAYSLMEQQPRSYAPYGFSAHHYMSLPDVYIKKGVKWNVFKIEQHYEAATEVMRVAADALSVIRSNIQTTNGTRLLDAEKDPYDAEQNSFVMTEPLFFRKLRKIRSLDAPSEFGAVLEPVRLGIAYYLMKDAASPTKQPVPTVPQALLLTLDIKDGLNGSSRTSLLHALNDQDATGYQSNHWYKATYALSKQHHSSRTVVPMRLGDDAQSPTLACNETDEEPGTTPFARLTLRGRETTYELQDAEEAGEGSSSDPVEPAAWYQMHFEGGYTSGGYEYVDVQARITVDVSEHIETIRREHNTWKQKSVDDDDYEEEWKDEMLARVYAPLEGVVHEIEVDIRYVPKKLPAASSPS